MAASNNNDIQLKIGAAVDGLVEIAKLITEVESLGGQTKRSSSDVERLATELDTLRKQDALINEFQRLKKSTTELADNLDDSRTRATALGKGLADAKQAVSEASSEYARSASETRKLGDEWAAAKAKIEVLRKAMAESESTTREQRDGLKSAREEARNLGEQYKASAKQTSSLESALASTQRAVKTQTREFNAARREVNQLDEQFIQQQSTLNGLRASLQESGVNTRSLSTAQRELKDATATAEQQVKALSTELTEQASQQRWMNQQVDATEQSLRNYDSAADRAATSTRDLSEQAQASTGHFSGWAKSIVASAAAFLSLDRAKDALVSIVQTGSEMDSLAKSARQLGISFEDVKRFTAETPLQLQEVMNAAIQAKNFGLDPFGGALQAAADAATAMGGGSEKVNSIILALGQSYGKMKLQGDDILQLINAGIPAWELLAQSTGKSVPELQKLSEAGKLGRDTINGLIDAIGKRYAGAAKAAMDSTKGLASNLSDSFTEVKATLANAGLMDFVNEQLRGIINTISDLKNNRSLQNWGAEIAQYMRMASIAVSDAISVVSALAPALKIAGSAWIGMRMATWATTLGQTADGFRKMATEAINAGNGIKTNALAAELASQSYGRMRGVMNAFAGTIGVVKNAMNGLVVAWGIGEIIKAYDAWMQMRDAQNQLAKSTQLATETGKQLKDRFEQISKQTGITITSMDQLDKLIESGAIHMDEATGVYQAGSAAVKAVGDSAIQAAPKVNKFYGNIDALIAKFDDLKPNSDEAAKVITDMFGEMEASSRTSVSYIITKLSELEKSGQIAGDALTNGLSKTLKDMSAKDLVDFQSSLQQVGGRLDDVGTKAQEASKKVSQELFSRLGLDLQQMRTGFTQAGQDTIRIFDDITKSGQYSSGEIRAAFDKAIDSAKTKQEADTLIGAYRRAAADGKVSSNDLTGSLQRISSKTNALVDDTNGLTDAYRNFGMKTRAELEQTAAQAKSDFDKISTSGQSVELVKDAFLKYAEAELEAAKASGRYADAALDSKAAQLGLGNQLDVLKAKVGTTGTEVEKTTAAIDALKNASDQAGNAQGNVTQSLSATEQNLKKQQAQIEQLQAHTRAASTGTAEFATAWEKASDVASMSVSQIQQKMEWSNKIYESSYNFLLKSNDISTQWWKPLVHQQFIAQKNNLQLLEQMSKVKNAIDELGNAEEPTQRLINKAEQAYGSASKLGKEDLSGLRNAIDSAKEKMASLASSAANTLSTLRDELDQMNENYAATEQRRYDAQIADLRAQLNKAESAGNRAAVESLQESLRLAEQIHKQKMETIKAEAAERAAQKIESAKQAAAAKTVTQQPAAAQQVTQQQATSTKVIRIELGGKSAEVSATPAQEANLMSLLNQLESARGITS